MECIKNKGSVFSFPFLFFLDWADVYYIHVGPPQGDIKDNKIIWKGFHKNSQ